MNRQHSYTQQKYALIAMLLVILYCLLFSCKIKPDGKDEKGWYVYRDSCVSSHQQTGTRPQIVGKTTIIVPYTYTVCDKEVIIKEYPNIEKLDTLR